MRAIQTQKLLQSVVLGFYFSMLVLASVGGSAHSAEDPAKYPARALRFIVPFPPGGGNDTIARAIGSMTWVVRTSAHDREGRVRCRMSPRDCRVRDGIRASIACKTSCSGRGSFAPRPRIERMVCTVSPETVDRSSPFCEG